MRVHADNILFIDASRHYEKASNQNYLNPEHISKIVNTYRNRQAEAKYSYIVSLDEVKENEYNLNIPRYVEAFEDENPVNLAAISEELVRLGNEMIETDKTLERYCKELGITTPF